MTYSKLIDSVNDLEKEAENIDKKVSSWLSNHFEFAYINELDTGNLWLEESFREEQRECIRLYQTWYLTAEFLVKKYLPDRKREFTKEYDPLLSLLQLWEENAKVNVNYLIREFTTRFDMQRNLLVSIPKMLEIRNLELRKTISADLVESELDEAKLLLDNDFIPAAGAVTGVALERYLKTLCEISTPPVKYNSRDTINELADKLKRGGHLSETKRKKIQFLADIRNKCVHSRVEESTKEEVKELIKGTKEFLTQK